MEEIDAETQDSNTLDDFNHLMDKVINSHVSRFGNISFKNDFIGEFVGYPETNATSTTPSILSEARIMFSLYDS